MNLIEAPYDGSNRSVVFGDGGRLEVPDGVARELERLGESGVVVGVRPEDIEVHRDAPAGGGLALAGRVVLRETLGHETLAHLDLGGQAIVVRGGDRFTGGEDGGIFIHARPEALHYFSKATGVRVGPDIAAG